MFVLAEFEADMRIGKMATATIKKRMELLTRLARFLDPTAVVDATEDDLRNFQRTFAHRSPATVDVYTRHMRAFYLWAHKRRWMQANLVEALELPRLRKGLPHPTEFADVRTIFQCATGSLRMAYALAFMAGMRRGEICRLERKDIDTSNPDVIALVHGKGGKDRKVPFIAPLMDELHGYGLARRGWIVRRNGLPYVPEQLSVDSTLFMQSLGIESTLHSLRHTFCTDVGRLTKDPMFVRDLAGHDSVATTEVYMKTDLDGAHAKLASFAAAADAVRSGRRTLHVVGT